MLSAMITNRLNHDRYWNHQRGDGVGVGCIGDEGWVIIELRMDSKRSEAEEAGCRMDGMRMMSRHGMSR